MGSYPIELANYLSLLLQSKQDNIDLGKILILTHYNSYIKQEAAMNTCLFKLFATKVSKCYTTTVVRPSKGKGMNHVYLENAFSKAMDIKYNTLYCSHLDIIEALCNVQNNGRLIIFILGSVNTEGYLYNPHITSNILYNVVLLYKCFSSVTIKTAMYTGQIYIDCKYANSSIYQCVREMYKIGISGFGSHTKSTINTCYRIYNSWTIAVTAGILDKLKYILHTYNIYYLNGTESTYKDEVDRIDTNMINSLKCIF
jgi:hypothetical protein